MKKSDHHINKLCFLCDKIVAGTNWARHCKAMHKNIKPDFDEIKKDANQRHNILKIFNKARLADSNQVLSKSIVDKEVEDKKEDSEFSFKSLTARIHEESKEIIDSLNMKIDKLERTLAGKRLREEDEKCPFANYDELVNVLTISLKGQEKSFRYVGVIKAMNKMGVDFDDLKKEKIKLIVNSKRGSTQTVWKAALKYCNEHLWSGFFCEFGKSRAKKKETWCPTRDELARILYELLKQGSAGLDCYFLYLSGLRVEDARKHKLSDFEFPAKVSQSKGSPDILVAIPEQFKVLAKMMNWSRIEATQSVLFKKISKIKKTYKDFNLHSLRHAHVSHSIELAMPRIHKNPKTTKIYIHTTPEGAIENSKRLIFGEFDVLLTQQNVDENKQLHT